MAKVILGLSGGVDSAVTGRLLQRQGHEVIGMYMDNSGPEARADARRTAEFLGVPLRIVDVHAQLEASVCRPFTEAYLRGETPNPCILCNPTVKFRNLLALAEAEGAEFIATGHYARTAEGALYRGRPANDQSYMLCGLTRPQLRRLLLPLGEYEKTEVRAMARDFGIPVADKPDSMEICFIPDKDYCGWIAARATLPPPGDIVREGTVIGRHEGIHRWTVGQRLPGLYDGEKLYVGAIDPEQNRVIAVPDARLYRTDFAAAEFRWLVDEPAGPVQGSVRVRHSRTETPGCTAAPLGGGLVCFTCPQPVRAPAPGQSAVLYDGERVLGGGRILSAAEAAARGIPEKSDAMEAEQ